jgi:hypothetical protein
MAATLHPIGIQSKEVELSKANLMDLRMDKKWGEKIDESS